MCIRVTEECVRVSEECVRVSVCVYVCVRGVEPVCVKGPGLLSRDCVRWSVKHTGSHRAGCHGRCM